MGQVRNHWLDNAKFILIFLVILGHCFDKFGEGNVCYSVNSTLYFFRMPLFVFLSGLFSKRIEWRRFLPWIWGVMETYLIFTLLQIALILALPQEPGFILSKDVLLEFFVVPRWTLWYLISLCFWRLAIQLFGAIISPILFLIISIIIGGLSGLIPLGPAMSFQRTLTYAPFFAIGYWCGRNKVDINLIKRIPAWFSIFIFFLLFVTVVVLLSSKFSGFPLIPFLRGMYDFRSFPEYSPILLVFLRLVIYLISVVVSVCVLRLIPSNNSWLSKQGLDTLFYYVYHPLLIIIIGVTIGRAFDLPSSFLAVLSYAVIITAVVWLMLRLNIFRALPRLISKSFSFHFNRTI